MSNRCDCPYPDPMTYGGPNPLCPEHGDPDAILASGRYTDRRGRRWHLCMHGSPLCGMWHQGHPSRGFTRAEMRTLIVRDLHRSECPGLRACFTHPVPHACIFQRWGAFPPHGGNGRGYPTHQAALDAARHMAGEQK